MLVIEWSIALAVRPVASSNDDLVLDFRQLSEGEDLKDLKLTVWLLDYRLEQRGRVLCSFMRDGRRPWIIIVMLQVLRTRLNRMNAVLTLR